ncbi:MAG: HigA family addiction module antitoxin [Candidatus Gastranaerophilales bacterium]|nr:HigA family addiction module antitoxin [Candidatus Gastranaerophilales bacterium]
MEMYNPCHPGELLLEGFIKELHMSLAEAALKLGVSRQNLSDIVHCKRGISPIMALRIAKAFNSDAALWVNMQAKYDLWQARQTANLDDVQIIYGG